MKSYTDLEQSLKLAEILPLESANMYFDGFGRLPQGYAYTLIFPNSFEYDKPCWSLAALLDILPDGTDIVKDKADTENEKYMCTVGIKDGIISTFGKNPVDACYEMIIKLYEQKLL